ncbi:hypothetical protein [Rufibacter hautae]|uniref:Uncharacterized protein n=1 Tax=Rufibacter hautae TaxID=2595005 RepID=A0A5B6TA52_9BACT|nr:hypothetical protein [Rufibacter hautae]KAA3436757.1 hypothetical protein FOA19_20480 [Rufibacter hautae]
MANVSEVIAGIENRVNYNKKQGVTVKKYVLDSNYNLTECGQPHEPFNLSQIFVYTFYYILETHVTMGGNIYWKPNFELLFLNYNNEEIELEANGWKVIDVQTFGEDYNYPQKQDIKFRLQDLLGGKTDWHSNKQMYGGYEEVFRDKIEYIVYCLLQASEFDSVDAYVNSGN